MRKVLKYKYFGNTGGGRHKVVITEQSHIGDAFGVYDNSFRCQNGFCLQSLTRPYVNSASISNVFVRGVDTGDNERPIYFSSLIALGAFDEMVKEYNSYEFDEIPAKEKKSEPIEFKKVFWVVQYIKNGRYLITDDGRSVKNISEAFLHHSRASARDWSGKDTKIVRIYVAGTINKIEVKR